MRKEGVDMEMLKLDLDIRDFEKVRSIVSRRCKAVFKILRIVPVGVRVCSTRRGYHIYLEIFGDYNSFDVCFLQMALGSDFKRETFNFYRFKNNLDKKWNVLFSEKRDEKGNVLSREVYEPALSDLLWADISKAGDGREQPGQGREIGVSSAQGPAPTPAQKSGEVNPL